MKNDPADYTDYMAPCGMNCSLCMAFLRQKNNCAGCRSNINKPYHCTKCIIVNCEFLSQTDSGFCYDCNVYPCKRLKNLDKRYRKNYSISLINNLEEIKATGLQLFIEKEKEKWICTKCGSKLCVHNKYCPECKTLYTHNNF